MNLQRVNISAVLDADNKLQIISFPIMLVLYSILNHTNEQKMWKSDYLYFHRNQQKTTNFIFIQLLEQCLPS